MPCYTVKAEITRRLGRSTKSVDIEVDVDTTDPLNGEIVRAAHRKAIAKYGCERVISLTGPSVRR